MGSSSCSRPFRSPPFGHCVGLWCILPPMFEQHVHHHSGLPRWPWLFPAEGGQAGWFSDHCSVSLSSRRESVPSVLALRKEKELMPWMDFSWEMMPAVQYKERAIYILMELKAEEEDMNSKDWNSIVKKSKECFVSFPLQSVRKHGVSGLAKFPPLGYWLTQNFWPRCLDRRRHWSSRSALPYLAPACSLSASVGWRGPWGSSASAAGWWSGPWWCRRAVAQGQSSGCPLEGLQRQSKANSNQTTAHKTEKEYKTKSLLSVKNRAVTKWPQPGHQV